MPRKKLTDALEGLIIIIVGAVFLGLALSIQNNPVKQSIPWVNALTQAKFFPIVCASAIIILGLIMFTSQLKGKRPSSKLSRQEWTRVGIVTLIVSAYTVAVYFINFTIPTIVYSVVILFYLNWGKKKPWYLLVIAALFVVLALVVLPKTIQLRLP